MSIKITNYSKEELAEKLESTRWSLDFTWNQIETITQYVVACSCQKGDVIFKQHSTTKAMAIIVKGKADIIKDEADGSSTKLATIFPSQSFGEMSLIDGEPRSANIIATEDTELLLLKKEDLFRLVDSNPTLAFKLLWSITQLLSQRLRKTSFNLVEQINQNKP